MANKDLRKGGAEDIASLFGKCQEYEAIKSPGNMFSEQIIKEAPHEDKLESSAYDLNADAAAQLIGLRQKMVVMAGRKTFACW